MSCAQFTITWFGRKPLRREVDESEDYAYYQWEYRSNVEVKDDCEVRGESPFHNIHDLLESFTTTNISCCHVSNQHYACDDVVDIAIDNTFEDFDEKHSYSSQLRRQARLVLCNL